MDEQRKDFLQSENEAEKSPLDSLREKLNISNNTDGQLSPDSGFTVQKPTGETVEIPAVIDIPKEEQENIAEETFEEVEETADEPHFEETEPEEAVFEEENSESMQAEEQTEELAPKNKFSLLKRMRRYTTDDNGVDVSKQEEPLYELDSVNSILGVEEEPEEPVEEFQTETENDTETEKTTPYISDIDMPEEIEEPVAEKPAKSDTATIRFTPVSDGAAKKTSVSVNTMTHNIDLGDELTENSAKSLDSGEHFEETEFEKFVPSSEIADHKDERKWLRTFALKKRNRFLCTVASGILCFVLLVFLIPPVQNLWSFNIKAFMITSSAILAAIALLNADMFLSVAKLRTGTLSFDINASLLTVSTLLLSLFSIINEEDSFPMIFICGFTLFIRSLMNFYVASNYCDNLRIISVPRPKKAVALISDNAVTSVMAKNSIEGNVLIATSKQSERITDFIKYSEHGEKLFGKTKFITVISFSLSVLCAIVLGLIKHSVVEAFYVSTLVFSLTALPILFFIDALPLRSAADRLNRKGAMLTGYTAAEQLNTANAAVIRTADLFPSGTVILKDMKVLSDNNVDDIILRAASLTDAISSPLCSIFKQIAKTNAAYDVPDSDTVKYEERLGISGWVNDERLFIGNRTLMEAHGISVPSLEVDRAILQNGYFPVYVSKDNTACVLLIIKYTVDPLVAKQLQDATNLGITVLIDNTDPNITNEMVCDYFGLYENSVFVMSSVGSNIHKAEMMPTENYSCGAAYKGNTLSLLQIMVSASKLKKSNMILTVVYCIAAILGIIYFVYGSFLSDITVLERASTLLIYEITATVISLAAFLVKRP